MATTRSSGDEPISGNTAYWRLTLWVVQGKSTLTLQMLQRAATAAAELSLQASLPASPVESRWPHFLTQKSSMKTVHGQRDQSLVKSVSSLCIPRRTSCRCSIAALCEAAKDTFIWIQRTTIRQQPYSVLSPIFCRCCDSLMRLSCSLGETKLKQLTPMPESP